MILIAVNMEYVSLDSEEKDGDELAFFCLLPEVK